MYCTVTLFFSSEGTNCSILVFPNANNIYNVIIITFRIIKSFATYTQFGVENSVAWATRTLPIVAEQTEQSGEKGFGKRVGQEPDGHSA